MNSPKLLEAIAELESQRRIIDDAIVHLKRAVAAMAGEPATVEISKVVNQIASSANSYVDEAVRAIQIAGHALHAKEIVNFIAQERGTHPVRASVESSIIRHISKAKEPKLMKSGPSTYDLKVYSQRSLPIAS